MLELKGSLVAIVTPMNNMGAIDYDALEGFINWQIEQHCDGLVVVGTTGESATLDEKEHCKVLRHAVEVVSGRVPVVAGTGANATTEAVSLTRCAAEAGVDAALLVTPYYNKPTQQGLYLHYRAVAEAVDIPQILYNVPGRTCCDLHNHTVKRLADIPNIIGLKDATGELGRLAELRTILGNDFLLFSGDDATACDFVLQGGNGVITVTGNVAPHPMHEMVAAALRHDETRAKSIDSRLQGLHKQLFVESSPIPTKWALHRMGLIPQGIRLPLTLLEREHEPLVEAALHDAGVL
jgi:4-hydroxy-tetrahydrodipicolinate synthase